MTIDTSNGKTAIWFNVVMFLLALGVSVLGWGFNNWSIAIEKTSAQLLQQLDKMERDMEETQQRLRLLEQKDAVFEQQHRVIEREIERLERMKWPNPSGSSSPMRETRCWPVPAAGSKGWTMASWMSWIDSESWWVCPFGSTLDIGVLSTMNGFPVLEPTARTLQAGQ